MTRFAAALGQIDGWIGPHGVRGAAAAVWFRGTLAAEHYVGEAQPGRAVDERTLFALASVTKPVAAATVMSLVAAGLVALDEPVVGFVPEFATAVAGESGAPDPGLEALRAQVTVRQLLAHTSGLPEDLGPRRVRFRDQPRTAGLTGAMCALRLLSAPGTVLRYSNAGYAVLSRLAERVSDEEFWALTRRRVLVPFGTDDIVARPGSFLEERIGWVQDAGGAGSNIESYNSAYWRELALPWGGLYGTVAALAGFAGIFLAAGQGVLAPVTVAAMIHDQAGGVPGGVESARVHWPVASWGLGWEVKGGKRQHWTGDLTSPRTFCHFGQAGTLLWADPERDLALAVFANRTVTHLWPFVPARWARLSNALIAAAS